MSITIKDVAIRAKVSIATVSLVINNNQRISEKTKKQVQKAIKELNYHPSHSARGLVSRTSGNIGFLLTEDHFLRSEPFYTRIFLGTEFEARESEQYILLTTISSNFKKGDKLPRYILEKNVDGVIIAGKVPDDIISAIEKHKLPIVFVDYVPPMGDKYSLVLIDNISGAQQAVKHLIDKGHQHIGFVAGDISHPSLYERYHGYKFALDAAGLYYDSDYYVIDEDYPSRENGYNAAKKLLEKNKNLTAIFACNDAMALGVLQYLKERKLNVPDDVALIGFDDVEANEVLDPPLSSMAVPKIEMGSEAFKLMASILKDEPKLTKKILMPVELVSREST